MANLTTSELYKIQFPDSTEIGAVNPTDDQLTSYIALVSEVIQTYLQRDLESKLRSEWHNSYDDNVIILNQYPISQIFGVLAGKEEWAQLDLTNSDDIVSLNFYNNDNEPSIDVITNMDTVLETVVVSDSANITELMTAIQTVLTTASITSTYRINTAYSSQKLSGLQTLTQSQGNDNSTFQFYGIDKNSTIAWTKEDDRNIILKQRVRMGSNTVLVKYVAGYTLPVTTDIGTLPRSINDVVNRIINGIFENDSGEGADLNYKHEKLGNSDYTNWDYSSAMESTFIQGLIERYSDQLDVYRRKDVAFY